MARESHFVGELHFCFCIQAVVVVVVVVVVGGGAAFGGCGPVVFVVVVCGKSGASDGSGEVGSKRGSEAAAYTI